MVSIQLGRAAAQRSRPKSPPMRRIVPTVIDHVFEKWLDVQTNSSCDESGVSSQAKLPETRCARRARSEASDEFAEILFLAFSACGGNKAGAAMLQCSK
jgi:hypothetical protein